MKIHTIGHSNHRWADFLALLRLHGVRMVVDVRSRPRSRFPQFFQPRLSQALEREGIAYRHLGAALGGKPDDPALYEQGKTPGKDFPDFARFRRTAIYQDGLAELEALLSEQPEGALCLLCAEENPTQCHRALLIAPDLVARGIEIMDIRKAELADSSGGCGADFA
jgi:uncharacterized protein (DUF488 family)